MIAVVYRGEFAVRVLVVEDDKDLRRQLVTALTDAGYAVDSASDGEEGYYLGDTEPYDIVVLDIGLPKMDGISILEQWRRSERKNGDAVHFWQAYIEHDDVVRFCVA